MAVGIASATNGNGRNAFVVCPNWAAGACACAKDDAGNPDPPHCSFLFVATLPAGWSMPNAPAEYLALGKTQAQWAALDAAHQWGFTCAVEAIRLVRHHLAQAAAPTNLAALTGVTA